MIFRYSLIIFLILLLIFRIFYSPKSFKNGDNIKITTTIRSEVIQYDKYQYLKFKGLKIYLPKYPEVIYGDRVEIVGEIESNRLKVKSFNIQKSAENNLFLRFRHRLITFYKSSLPEPYSSLVAGIVLGSKNMPSEFWEKLKLTGTAHIVVASGTNITLLTSFLISSLTLFIKRKNAVFITGAGIILYLFLSGFDAPLVRASIMAGIVFLAQIKGKVIETFKVLIITAILMLIIMPEWITDLGFLLSFVASGSIIVFGKRLEKYVSRFPNVFKESLVTTISAQIGVLPILYLTFGQFNIASFIINPLVLWITPHVMVLGALGGIIGLIVPIFGKFILFVLFPLLYYFVQVIEIFNF
jgi:competence protein ComEC